jgi:type II secretory pathway component PulF
MFTRRIPLPDLIDLCRSMRHQLSAGLSIQRVLKQQSERGRASVRSIAARVSDAIRGGDSFSDALEREQRAFPPLFLAMAKVGETTGHLAETFGELERYFALELQLRRQFRSQTILPILQFFLAVFLMAGVIYVLGLIGSMNNARPLFTIFGLSGGAGSLAFLGMVFGALASVWLLYSVISRLGHQKTWMDRVLLSLPGIGPCVRAVIMSRFTLAMHLTLDSGLSIWKAVGLSFDATGNAFFASRSGAAVKSLKSGMSLHTALESARLFDDSFLETVIVSEETGGVPELMRTLSQQYQEDAGHKLKLASRVAAMGVGFCVMAFIVWGIFQFANVYIGLFDKV